jgi:DNA-binding CsgD family transcriptional regulator
VTLAEAIRLQNLPGFESALWKVFHGLCQPDNLLILIYLDSGPVEILHSFAKSSQAFAEIRNTYTAGAYVLDPYYDLHLRAVPAGAYRLRDVAPDAFHRSRYFIEYYDQTTLIDEVTFVSYPVDGATLNICLGRDRSSGRPFTAPQIEACHRVAPMINALASRHWSNLTARPGSAEDVTSQLVNAASTVHAIHLSARQAEVALLILKGHSTVSAALRLGLSPQTIKVFRKQLYAKCRISSQAELFALMLPLLKGIV